MEYKYSIPNFREVITCRPKPKAKAKNEAARPCADTVTVRNTEVKLYRSSSPAIIPKEEVSDFASTFKTILDFRDLSEFQRDKVRQNPQLDKNYSFVEVKLGNPNYHFEEVQRKTKSNTNDVSSKMHFFINFFPTLLVFKTIACLPLFKRLWAYFLGIVHLLSFGFISDKLISMFWIKHYLVPSGLHGQTIFQLNNCQQQIKAAFDILCDENNYPVVICCSSGKDRTGIMSALVQGCCGIQEDQIVEDYAKSEREIEGLGRVQEQYRALGLTDDFFWSRPETMRACLHYINTRYGDIRAYLETAGVTREQQTKLKNLLCGGM